MKKSIKKLSINKETVADLNSDLLERVIAGAKTVPVQSGETDCVNVYACNPQSHPVECITAPVTHYTCFEFTCIYPCKD